MNQLTIWLVILVAFASQYGGILMFARGFFPKKVLLSGLGTFYPEPDSPFPQEVQFDHMVFVLIDALRSDFLFSESSQFSSVHSLLNSGEALGFTAHSTPPTVTLPRLKGLTTGSTPSFLDAVLNIAESDTSSSLGASDSWLLQLKSRGKRLHMFGDDTWLKLFPGVFDESEGTSSFFVSDFTEVDNNVTRHIEPQLARSGEWDVLILHYLGLDHIGHKGGPESPFMAPKQQEMNQVVERLYQHTSKHNGLLVVCGDHGMNELGNHGGSSAGETSAGLVLASPKFKQLKEERPRSPLPCTEDYKYYEEIEQIDLVPTLSVLLNSPLPVNSIGVVIDRFLKLYSPDSQLRILEQNCHQMKRVVEEFYGREIIAGGDQSTGKECMAVDSEFDRLSCLWNLQELNSSVESKYAFLREAQSLLSQASSNYVMDDLINGILLVSGAFFASVSLYYAFVSCVRFVDVMFFTVSTVYALTFFGSSLIEEEYQIWFWTMTAVFAVLAVAGARLKCDWTVAKDWVKIFLLTRLIRCFNSTGQKFNMEYSLATFLNSPENSWLIWLLVILTLVRLGYNLSCGGLSMMSRMLSFTVVFAFIGLIFTFKLLQTFNTGEGLPGFVQSLIAQRFQLIDSGLVENSMLIGLSKLAFKLAGLLLLIRLFILWKERKEEKGLNGKHMFFSDICSLAAAVLVMQTRPENIGMFLVFDLLREQLTITLNKYLLRVSKESNKDSVCLRCVPAVAYLVTLALSNLSFFSMGETNSLATIDLSNAYNGIDDYLMVPVGILLFVSNWAGPIYWSFALGSIIFENDYILAVILLALRQKNGNMDLELTKNGTKIVKWTLFQNMVICSLVFYSLAAMGLFTACTILRHHLFIWTVFSPKVLYFLSWSILLNGVVSVVVMGGFVYIYG